MRNREREAPCESHANEEGESCERRYSLIEPTSKKTVVTITDQKSSVVYRGSKKNLWTESDVINAVIYDEYDQGEPL